MRVPRLIENTNVVNLKVEELVDRLESALDRKVVLELNRHLLPRERLECRKDELDTREGSETRQNPHVGSCCQASGLTMAIAGARTVYVW